MKRLNNLGLSVALAAIGRTFINEPGSRQRRNLYRGQFYIPNGDREVRRRLRHEIRALAKRAIEVISLDAAGNTRTIYASVWDQLTQDPENYDKFLGASRERLLEIRNNLLADLKGESHVS